MASVQIQNVRKSFGANPVIHGVDVDIVDGEFVILVGPSGCGKSTLLRMIAGLESVTRGAIRIGQRVVNNVPPKERDIAMVFQNYALYPHMTVAENMAFSLKLRKAPKSVMDDRVAKAGGILGLAKLLDRYRQMPRPRSQQEGRGDRPDRHRQGLQPLQADEGEARGAGWRLRRATAHCQRARPNRPSSGRLITARRCLPYRWKQTLPSPCG